MLTHVNYIFCSDHFAISTNIESLCHTPEINKCFISIISQFKQYQHMWKRLLSVYQNPCSSFWHISRRFIFSCSHTLSCYWVLGNRNWAEVMDALSVLCNFYRFFPLCVLLYFIPTSGYLGWQYPKGLWNLYIEVGRTTFGLG